MALDLGDKTCTTGLSARVYDTLKAEWLAALSYDLDNESAETQQTYQLLCYSIAKGIVDEIVANSEIDSGIATITTSDAGLQRDPASSDDCLAPASDKTIGVTGSVK